MKGLFRVPTARSAPAESTPPETWHVTKAIPAVTIVTIFAAILAQSAALVWQVSQLNTRLEQHTTDIAALKAFDAASQANDRKTVDILARLEERLAGQTRILERVERSLIPIRQ